MLPPTQTPVPRPILMQQSTATATATATATDTATATATPVPQPVPAGQPASARPPASPAGSEPAFTLPKLLLEIRDLRDRGAQAFLRAMDGGMVAEQYLLVVLGLLYREGGPMPATRSVTLVVRSMPGVAYTTGKELDGDHKEIHFSTEYMAGLGRERAGAEMTGVLAHELVHCVQWTGRGTVPSGLTEGIADWVRLNCGLAPPHWTRTAHGDWDAGYQHTAYFLDYLEDRFGDGTVRRLNGRLRDVEYHEKAFWKEAVGCSVHRLWVDYAEWLERQTPPQAPDPPSEPDPPPQGDRLTPPADLDTNTTATDRGEKGPTKTTTTTATATAG
ncbi:MAG: hypothetical protein M1826_001854 [Phylliscum demangeonii]|nr:MAG: hypothetical protein M1826_001854 [Phylliscum demangeonii]